MQLKEPIFGSHHPLTLESYRAFGEQVVLKGVADIMARATEKERVASLADLRKHYELDPKNPPSEELQKALEDAEFRDKYLNAGVFEGSIRSILHTDRLRKEVGTEVSRMLTEAQLPTIPIFALDKPGSNPIEISQHFLDREPRIWIRTNALKLLTEDELIAFIGHEIGHRKAGHKIDGCTRPEEEYEADHIGAELSRRPRALITGLQKMDLYCKELNQVAIEKTLPPLLAGSRGGWRRHLAEGAMRTGGEWVLGRHPKVSYRIHRLEKDFAKELGLSSQAHRLTTNDSETAQLR
jgi:hypothetical protein